MSRAVGVLVLSASCVLVGGGCQQDGSKPPTSSVSREAVGKVRVYDESADANEQIASALAAAGAKGHRVLIQWGGNWCGWCLRLNRLMTTDSTIKRELRERYEVVHIDTGMPDNKNVALAERYGAAVKEEGFPYLTVLDADGSVVANHDTGSFEIGPIEEGHDPARVLAWLRHPTSNTGAPGGR